MSNKIKLLLFLSVSVLLIFASVTFICNSSNASGHVILYDCANVEHSIDEEGIEVLQHSEKYIFYNSKYNYEAFADKYQIMNSSLNDDFYSEVWQYSSGMDNYVTFYAMSDSMLTVFFVFTEKECELFCHKNTMAIMKIIKDDNDVVQTYASSYYCRTLSRSYSFTNNSWNSWKVGDIKSYTPSTHYKNGYYNLWSQSTFPDTYVEGETKDYRILSSNMHIFDMHNIYFLYPNYFGPDYFLTHGNYSSTSYWGNGANFLKTEFYYVSSSAPSNYDKFIDCNPYTRDSLNLVESSSNHCYFTSFDCGYIGSDSYNYSAEVVKFYIDYGYDSYVANHLDDYTLCVDVDFQCSNVAFSQSSNHYDLSLNTTKCNIFKPNNFYTYDSGDSSHRKAFVFSPVFPDKYFNNVKVVQPSLVTDERVSDCYVTFTVYLLDSLNHKSNVYVKKYDLITGYYTESGDITENNKPFTQIDSSTGEVIIPDSFTDTGNSGFSSSSSTVNNNPYYYNYNNHTITNDNNPTFNNNITVEGDSINNEVDNEINGDLSSDDSSSLFGKIIGFFKGFTDNSFVALFNGFFSCFPSEVVSVIFSAIGIIAALAVFKFVRK